MELRGTHLILLAILSTVTPLISKGAPPNSSRPAKKSTPAPSKGTAGQATKAKYPPAHAFRPKALVIRKAPAEVIQPRVRPETPRGKFLAARRAGKPNQWLIRFEPLEKGLTLDSTKTMLISMETKAGAAVSPESVFRQQWDGKKQGFQLTYRPGSKPGPAEIVVHGAFTVCDSTKKTCRKVYEDFRFDPTL